jgi:predicted transcriptional regulator
MDRTNPEFVRSVRENPLQGTPLNDAADPITPTPPRTLGLSDMQLKAWEKVKGKLSDTRTLVLSIIAEIGPATTQEIAQECGWERHRISGRVTELYQLGLIDKVGRKVDPDSGTSSALYQAKANYKELLTVLPGNWLNS